MSRTMSWDQIGGGDAYWWLLAKRGAEYLVVKFESAFTSPDGEGRVVGRLEFFYASVKKPAKLTDILGIASRDGLEVAVQSGKLVLGKITQANSLSLNEI